MAFKTHLANQSRAVADVRGESTQLRVCGSLSRRAEEFRQSGLRSHTGDKVRQGSQELAQGQRGHKMRSGGWRRLLSAAVLTVPERQRTTCESRITTVAAVETAPPDRSARQSTKVVLRMVAVPAGMWKAPPSPSSDWHSSTETSRASKVGGSSSVCESTRAPPPCRAVQPLICTRSITAFTASRLSAPPSSSAAHLRGKMQA
eukprot:2385890-Pleurochrysis_carterae.AAC.1